MGPANPLVSCCSPHTLIHTYNRADNPHCTLSSHAQLLACHHTHWHCWTAGQFQKDQEYNATLETLEGRLEKHVRQGGVGESGGCTDASVRLSTLLKVLCMLLSITSCAALI